MKNLVATSPLILLIFPLVSCGTVQNSTKLSPTHVATSTTNIRLLSSTTSTVPEVTTTTEDPLVAWRSYYGPQLRVLTTAHNVCVTDINNLAPEKVESAKDSSQVVSDCQAYEDLIQQEMQWPSIPDQVAQQDLSAANKLNFDWAGKVVVSAEQHINPLWNSNVANEIDAANNYVQLMNSQLAHDAPPTSA